jgi:Zn-dependent peptidase ImmA (M78 family)/transcriptional regulator with XRE-family HTH domain
LDALDNIREEGRLVAISSEELANRIRAARENAGLTQQQISDYVGISRTAIVQIEAGKRAVNSLELEKLARLFGRGIEDFVAESPFVEDPIAVLLRAAPGFANEERLGSDLRKFANLAREATQLEELLGIQTTRLTPPRYDLRMPSARWEAVRQGKTLAVEERKRIALGDSPIREIAEIVRSQGVRATEAEMPDDISGLFFHRPDTGAVIVVNSGNVLPRRLFSFAHEYGHSLADRDSAGTVSRRANSEELAEVRANAFAAHFLMPEEGVKGFLRGVLGKGEPTRQNQEVFGEGAEPVAVQSRVRAGSQEIQVHDVLRLAHHFGVRYEAALFQLLNLNLLTRDRFESLRAETAVAKSLKRALRLPDDENGPHWDLAEQIVSLALEAHRRGLISRKKVLELAVEVGASPREIGDALFTEEAEEESVPPVFPE